MVGGLKEITAVVRIAMKNTVLHASRLLILEPLHALPNLWTRGNIEIAVSLADAPVF